MSPDVHVVHVATGDAKEPRADLQRVWPRLAEQPARGAGLPLPQLAVFTSPYRHVIMPIRDHVSDLEARYPDRSATVLIPEMVERHW